MNEPYTQVDDEKAITEQYEKTMQEIQVLRDKIEKLTEEKGYSNSQKPLVQQFDLHTKQSQKETESASAMMNKPLNPSNTTNSNKNKSPNNSPNQPIKKRKNLSMLRCKMKTYSKLEGHGNKVYAVDWNPINPNRIVSVGRDGKMIFWNISTSKKTLAYTLDTEFVMTLAYSPDSLIVACGGLDDTLSIYNVDPEVTGLVTNPQPHQLNGHQGYLSSVAFVDNRRILSGSGDSSIIEWDLNKFTAKQTLELHKQDVVSIAVNHTDPNLLLSGSVDSTVKVIDLREYEVTQSLTMYNRSVSKKRKTDVNVVKWFPDGQAFVTGCDDGSVSLFDMRSCRVLNSYSYEHSAEQKAVKHSSEKIELYDEMEDTNGVSTLCFSKSGAFLFCSYNSDDHHVSVWNCLSGEVVNKLQHSKHVSSLAVSPHGDRVVTACWDHHLRLWKLSK